MKIEPIALFSSFQQKIVFLILLMLVLFFNLSYKYDDYLDFTQEEFVQVKATAVNIYPKLDYNIVRFKASGFEFFTSVDNTIKMNKNDSYSLVVLTQKIDFMDYLKGFYTKSFFHTVDSKSNLKRDIQNYISAQHHSIHLQELFSALFLATPLNPILRDFFAKLGISHLIAISGFHLGVLSFCLYLIINNLYKPIHQRYFLYRNRRFDVMCLSICILCAYLILTGVVPSLLRAFIMFVVALYFLRCNINILSYEVLLYCFLVIVALFPTYIFSVGLWFSFMAVFYIYLFIQYFTKGNKLFLILFFNIWIFLVFNPIVHYFFDQTAYMQLLSPLITILFTLFYPLELFLHLVGYGYILDEYLIPLMTFEIKSFAVFTPWWFLLIYLFISILSIVKKEAFYCLNVLLVGFNLYLYCQIGLY